MDRRYYYEVSVESSGIKDGFTGYLIAETYNEAHTTLDNHLNIMGYDDDDIKMQMLEHVDSDDILELQIDDLRGDFDNLEDAISSLLIELNITPLDLKNRTTQQGISNVVCQKLIDTMKL